MHFQCNRCVLNQSPNVSTKFGEDWQIVSLKKWQPCFEIKDGSGRHLEFLNFFISDVIDMFQIEVPMFSQILVTIGQIIGHWQQFSKIQDGGGRHLE